METSLDEAAAEMRSGFRGGGRRMYHPTDGEALPTDGGETAAAAAETDYLTASLGRYEGGAPGGALPMDRYGGRRIRCKAVLRSNVPNDKGREVRIDCT